MGHQVFISHSSKDKLIADAIVSHLERNGIRCWVAPRDILPGAKWAESILSAIAESKLMVLVFSDHTNSSQHVQSEVERAVHHGIPVAPVRIRDVMPAGSLELFLSSSHWMDAITPPLESHLKQLAGKVKLLLDSKAELSEDPAPATTPRQKRRRALPLATVVIMMLLLALGSLYAHGDLKQMVRRFRLGFDPRELQHTWILDKEYRDGDVLSAEERKSHFLTWNRIVIDEDTLQIGYDGATDNQLSQPMKYSLGPTSPENHFGFVWSDAGKVPVTWYGTYKLEGSTLRIAFSKDFLSPPTAADDADPGNGYYQYVLHR